MRIRTIKPEFFTHEELADLEASSSLPVRIAFIGLWCVCDREGRFKWKPRSLSVQILPYDNVDFTEVLDLLVRRGFIYRYKVKDKEYGFIPSFAKHQVINNREQESTIPPIPSFNDDLFCPDLTRESGVNDARKRSKNTCADAGQGEGKGRKEGKGIDVLPYDSDSFKLAWEDWKRHRIEKKKKLTPSTAALQLKQMVEIGEIRSIAMIQYSIKNGWMGLFEDATSKVTPLRKPQTADQFGI